MPELLNKQSIALAGEFFVLAQLSMKNLIGTLTLGHTKAVDILVSNPNSGNLYRLEVKTTSKGQYKNKQFGTNFEWFMSEKHQTLIDNKLFYCFVAWRGEKLMPRFFIVPSKTVAKYVKDQHEYWEKLPHKRKLKPSSMRMFRITDDSKSHGLKAKDYENKWDLLK